MFDANRVNVDQKNCDKVQSQTLAYNDKKTLAKARVFKLW